MSNPYDPPPPVSPFAQQFPTGPIPERGDETGGIIPYKNPYALIAYYTGILTLLCCITPIPLGIAPLVLGIIGLQKRAANPIIKGSVHAWIGIVLGGISAIFSVIVAILIVIGLLNQ